MKIFKIKYLVAVLMVLAFFGCENDEIKTVMTAGTAPKLTLSQPTVVLTSAKAAETAQTITWQRADYGFKAAVSYTVQIAKAGTDFKTVKEVVGGNATDVKYTTADLNQLAILLGLKPASVGKLDVRVKAVLSESTPPLYSNVATLDVTPYQVIIDYPSLWVPGAYQGWDPAKAPKISSILGNGSYEGFINFTGSDLNFKLTSTPDWNNKIYGWASSTTADGNVTGTFNTTGGNLFVPAVGYYLIKGNTNDNSWSATKITSMAIIGDAPVASKDWANDVPMTYDAVTNTWKVTTAFKAGAFKFRINADWGLNFGDTGADLSLEYNGANISIPAAGTYTVTLDLKPGNYSYEIK